MAAYPFQDWKFMAGEQSAESSDFDARVEDSVNQPCTYEFNTKFELPVGVSLEVSVHSTM